MTESMHGSIQNVPPSPETRFSAQILGFLAGDRRSLSREFPILDVNPHETQQIKKTVALMILSRAMTGNTDRARFKQAREIINSWE